MLITKKLSKKSRSYSMLLPVQRKRILSRLLSILLKAVVCHPKIGVNYRIIFF